MKSKVQAMLHVDEGEEIASACASPHIRGVGVYKFLAKRKADSTFEWAHFVQRDSGQKEKIYRGETETRDQLDEVLAIMNRNLKKVFKVEMHPADYNPYSLDGKKAPETRQ
jgi:hypothetical protein